MTFLELRVLGNFEARDKANQLVDVSAKKNRALLAILALSPSGWVPRQQLANLLWSDREDVHARSSLRQSLASLRKDFSAIDPSLVSADDEKLILDCAKVEIDAARFQRFATSDDVEVLRQAMSLYRGELLADTTIRDPAFEEWIASERARLHEIAVTILETLWAVERSGHRIDVAKRLVALDPLKESSHRALMQAYAEVGENARALQHYATCRDLLKTGYGIAPGNESCVNKSCVRAREPQLPRGARLPQKPCPLRNSQLGRNATDPNRTSRRF
jgi:DNA-binding SARP family transcriptional activator